MNKILLFAMIFLAACSGGDQHGKKLLVISSGKLDVKSTSATSIGFEPGTQHNEKELVYKGSGNLTLTVTMPGGNKTYELNEDGTYLLNLQKDTVIGSAVNYGNAGVPASISSEELSRIIDSTEQLMAGKNASDEKKTYFLPPQTLKKISSSQSATILSPYKNIPYKIEADKDGNMPEMYKFFSNTQKREALEELIKRLQ